MATWEDERAADFKALSCVERAAGYLVRNAPVTEQERWEENAGYSPSTLAADISALICAAEMARAHESPELATFWKRWLTGLRANLRTGP